MQMGANGLIWVWWGVGVRGEHRNKTSTGKTGMTGYVRVTCMAGKFPGKTHTCAYRHKRVMRDSGGWGWVRMGPGGCIGTQQTQRRYKEGLVGAQDTIVGKHLKGSMHSKMARPPHDHHRAFRLFLEAQRMLQAAHICL